MVSRLYNSVIMIYLSNINRHSWIWCSVCDYITAGVDAKIVDTDGGVHSVVLWAHFANQVSPIPGVHPFEVGHLVCSSFCHLIMVALLRIGRALPLLHLELLKWNTRRKEIACLVMTMSGWLGFHLVLPPTALVSSMVLGSHLSCPLYAIPLLLLLSSAQYNCIAGTGRCCKHVATMLCNILDCVELGLAIVPEDKLALTPHKME